jgi:nucleoporin NUP82
MYDLGGNLNEPELLLDLKARLGYEQRSQKAAFSRSTFSAEVDAAEFATFTFGKSDNGWSSLSIYVLMANGDLYSVCPILPSHR